MPTAWQQYQRDTASFFEQLGLKSTVEAKVQGVRALHAIDVLVEGDFLGIGFRWIVECKAWKSNVPKEKVLALSSIVQDIGADRGFLLSEKGFQSGAIQASRSTNIALTSLDDLAAVVGPRALTARVDQLHTRMRKATDRLRRWKKELYDDEFYPPVMAPLGIMFGLDQVIDEAMRGEFPVPYIEGDQRKLVHSLDEALAEVDRLIAIAEAWRPPVQSD